MKMAVGKSPLFWQTSLVLSALLVILLLPLVNFLHKHIYLHMTVFFNISIVFLLTLWLLKSLLCGEFEIKYSALHLIILLFLIICFISSFFSPFAYLNFISSNSYQPRFLITFQFVIFFFLLFTFFGNFFFLNSAILCLILAASILSIHSFVFPVLSYFFSTDAFSTGAIMVSVPVHFKGFAAAIIPLCFACYIITLHKPQSHLFAFAWILLICSVIATYSRSDWLGLFVGIIVFFTLIGIRVVFQHWKILIHGIILTLAVFMLGLYSYKYPGEMGSVSERALSSFEFKKESVAVRLSIWRSALRIIKDYPLKGAGLGSLSVLSPKYREAKTNVLQGDTLFFSHADNEFLDVAISTGFLGLGVFLWILLFFVLSLWGFIHLETVPKDHRVMACGLIAGFIGYHVRSFFYLSEIWLSTLSWIFLSMSACFIRTRSIVFPLHFNALKLYSCVSIVLIGALLLFYFASKPIYAAQLLLNARRFYLSQDFDKVESMMKKAASLQPKNCHSWYSLGRFFQKKADRKLDTSTEPAEILYFKKAVACNPLDPAYHLALGLAFHRRGFVEDAVKETSQAVQLCPTCASYFQELGDILSRAGRHEEALKAFEKSLKLNPTRTNAYFNLGVCYANMGNARKALHYLQKTLKLNPRDTEAKQMIQKLSSSLKP